MNSVDKIYNDLVKDIYNNGYSDKNMEVRAKYGDGTPANCTSVFGKQVEFGTDVMPLLTGKKVFTKSAIKEMVLFWVKQTVKEDDFKEDKVRIWDEWFVNGSLGKSYAYQLESRPNREIVKVKVRSKSHHGELKNIIVGLREDINTECLDELIGKTITSKVSGAFRVLDVFNGGKEFHNKLVAKVQFEDTNYCTTVYKENAKRGTVKDIYRRSYYNVGYLGDYKSVKNYNEREVERLKSVWRAMVKRCYACYHKTYELYGGRGVFVEERWHSFENFLRDIRYTPQFFIAKSEGFVGWELDKDYFGGVVYSKDTCVWLTKEDNKLYRSSTPFNLIKDNTIIGMYINLKDAAEKNGLGKSGLSNVFTGKYKHTRGFTIEKVDIEDGYVYRYKLSRNQVVDLIHNIKSNPTSKRLLTSFWNDADVNDKVLQECAWATNWRVAGDTLELILIQRSGDIGLGVPFNWFQYKILQMMIAYVTGLKPGKFIHQVANLHYYDRHEETLLKQCENETYEPPTIKINEDVKDFFDFTVDDIIIENYKCGDYLHMEVAI